MEGGIEVSVSPNLTTQGLPHDTPQSYPKLGIEGPEPPESRQKYSFSATNLPSTSLGVIWSK